jgi:TetR/AcrR family transcriptional repressor of nem operon
MSNRPVTTKERILDAAEGLMLAKSFHSVGLNEILTAVQVPKGSFYHYFKSKEQFGVEMLQHYVDGATAYKTRMLLAPVPEPDPLRRLMTYLEGTIVKSHESEGKCPCLVIKLAAEVGDFSEPMRGVLAQGIRQWIAILQQLLEQGLASGSIAKRVDPVAMAAVIQDLWTGAMQRAATARETTPLRDALAFIRTLLAP